MSVKRDLPFRHRQFARGRGTVRPKLSRAAMESGSAQRWTVRARLPTTPASLNEALRPGLEPTEHWFPGKEEPGPTCFEPDRRPQGSDTQGRKQQDRDKKEKRGEPAGFPRIFPTANKRNGNVLHREENSLFVVCIQRSYHILSKLGNDRTFWRQAKRDLDGYPDSRTGFPQEIQIEPTCRVTKVLLIGFESS